MVEYNSQRITKRYQLEQNLLRNLRNPMRTSAVVYAETEQMGGGMAVAKCYNLTGVLDHLDDKADGQDLTLGQVIDAFGGRGYGPMLLAAALIEILPTGAIPGVPTLVAITVILIAGQLAAGRQAPWVPKKLRSKGFNRGKLEKARNKIRPFTQKLDKAIKPRMEQFTTPFAARAVGVICVILAMTMPPLEFVPFASSVPSTAIALFSIGLASRDGLIILLGFIAAAGAAAGALYWLVL